MEQTQQAINTLINAAAKGQSVGAYNLEEAAIIFNAIQILQTPPETPAKEQEKPSK